MARKDIIDTSNSGNFRNLVTSKSLITQDSLELDGGYVPQTVLPDYKETVVQTPKVVSPFIPIYQEKIGDSSGSVPKDLDIKPVDEVVINNEVVTNEQVIPDETSDWKIVEETDSPISESQSTSFLGFGSGGGGSVGSSSEQEQVAGGGYVQTAKGIIVSGWVYPYRFILLTLGCGALGLFIGYKFKKELLVKLALSAAGLMAGSALGMKTFPPVKKVG